MKTLRFVKNAGGRMSGHAGFILSLTLALASPAWCGTITVTNVNSSSLSSSRPVLYNDCVPVNTVQGFAAVGTFRSMGDEEIQRVSVSGLGALDGDFFQYGIRHDFGHFGFEGLYSGTSERTTALPAEVVGKPIYTVIGDGSRINNSSQLLVYKHSDQPTLGADPFSADADLSDGAGELIVGLFGKQASVSDGGGLILSDLPSFQLLRLPNDLAAPAGSCAVEVVSQFRYSAPGASAMLPAVACDAAGRSVLTWTETGILGFKCRYSTFDAGGDLVVDDAAVDSAGSGQFGSVVAMRGDGSFIITWLALDGGGPNFHVFARRFDPAGSPLGDAFQVSVDSFAEFVAYRSGGDDERRKLSIAIHGASGEFAIGWGGPGDVLLRLFDASGGAKGVPIVVDSSPASLGSNRFGMAPVGVDAAGNVHLAYREQSEIRLVKFDSAGAVAVSEVVVSDASLGDADPQLGVEPDGACLVGWFEDDPAPGDTFLRRWYAPDLVPLTTDYAVGVEGTFGAAVISAGSGQRQHWTAHVDPGDEHYYIELFEAGAAGLLLPAVQIVERDPDINQNTWGIAAGGNHLVACFETEFDEAQTLVELVRFAVTTTAGFGFPLSQTLVNRQEDPDVASDGDDRAVAVWVDSANGGVDQVFGRLFDGAGVPRGGEFLIGPARDDDQRLPRVAMAADGQLIVAWGGDESDSDGRGVLARRYAASGLPLGEVFLVNEAEQADDQFQPVVAMAGDGRAVVAFVSEASGDARVVFQRFDAAGDPAGPLVPVASPAAGIDDEEPSIAMNSAGKFVIAWRREGVPVQGGGTTTEIYIRSYAADGTPIFPEVKAGPQGRHVDAFVALNDNDDWAVVWQTEESVVSPLRGSPTPSLVASRGALGSAAPVRIFEFVAAEAFSSVDVVLGDDGVLEVASEARGQVLQALRFDADHNPIGVPFELAPEGDSPRLAVLAGGRRFAVWDVNNSGATSTDAMGRVFGYGENYPQFLEGTDRLVNDFVPGDQNMPRVAINELGLAAVVWQGDFSGGSRLGVSARLLGPDNTFTTDEDIRVASSSTQDYGIPDVSWLDDQRYLVAWAQATEDDGTDLFYRKMNADPFLINPVAVPLFSGLVNLDLRVAGREDGTFAAAWTRRSSIFSSDNEVHLKVIDPNGGQISSAETQISSSVRPGFHPTIDLLGSHLLVAWSERYPSPVERDQLAVRLYEVDGTNVFLRRLGSFPNLIGDSPSVALREDGSSVIAWVGDDGAGGVRIFARCLDRFLNVYGAAIEIDPRETSDAGEVEVAMDADGDFTLVWQSDRFLASREDDVFLWRFDSQGFPVGSEFDVVSENLTNDQENPDIAMNGSGDGVIVWEEDDPVTGDTDVRIRRLSSLNVRTRFSAWAESFGDPAVEDPEGDPDCDGLNNLLEYIMNLNPLVVDSEMLPPPTFSYVEGEDGGRVSFRWRQRNDDPDIRAVVQESTDLKQWDPAPTVSGSQVIDDLTDLRAEGVLFPATEKYFRIHFSLDVDGL